MVDSVSKSIRDHFGSRVRELREERGYSQEKFAEICGLHRTYISGVERGERNPTLDVISKISTGLDVDLPCLFQFE
ncbi:helix-turn-helix transcriptional regulator [Salinibacter ruber]|uniref:helix-turn-helix domain-containing protein n=1 Tax=Salinibacter ruber TaxID=146919 RepID=UPI00311AB87A